MMRNSERAKKHFLSDRITWKSWYNRSAIEDNEQSESGAIVLQIPSIDFVSLNDELTAKMQRAILLLGRIFKRLGVDPVDKELDSQKSGLEVKLTNEFINNDVQVETNDLQMFIQRYFNQQREKKNSRVTWFDFRDMFLPIANGGWFSRDDIFRWFDVINESSQDVLNRDQVLLLLRLLQFNSSEQLLDKMNEISPSFATNNRTWTLNELIFAMENLDEIKSRFLTSAEQIAQTSPFNLEWLKKNKSSV